MPFRLEAAQRRNCLDCAPNRRVVSAEFYGKRWQATVEKVGAGGTATDTPSIKTIGALIFHLVHGKVAPSTYFLYSVNMPSMNDPFLRQRRNLFVVSTILLALCLGGVDIQELSIAGMKFSAFKKPEVFLGGVWIAFWYFSYRYLVYSLECSPEELKKTFIRELEKAVNPRIERLVRRKYSKPNEACLFSYAFLRRDGRTYKGQALLPMENDPSKHELKPIELPIPFWSTLPWEIWGVVRFAVLTPAVTEHLLPFAIAAGTLVYCGFLSTWEGSFRALTG